MHFLLVCPSSSKWPECFATDGRGVYHRNGLGNLNYQ